jgi:predicted DNA-binding transcriptional regulator AlpA
MSTAPAVPQLAGKAGIVATMLGVSPSTVRRLARKDPEFPRPFRLSARGDSLWSLAEIRAYIRRKAAEPTAA